MAGQRAYAQADAKRETVQLQRDAAAEAGFEIYVAGWLHLHAKIEAVIADKSGATSLHAGVQVAFAIGGFPIRGAHGCGGTAEDPTDNGLCAPGSHIVRGSRQAERSGVNFRASLGLKVVTKGDERAVKVLGVADGVANSRVNERSENAESVFKMVGPIPGGVTCAETLLGFAGWRSKVDSRIVVEEFAGEVPLQIGAQASQAIAGDYLRIVLLHGRRSAYKVVRNAQIHAEMAGKVVAHAGAQIEDAAITAGATFELHSRVESWGEAHRRLCKRTCGRRSWRLSVIRRAIRKYEKR